MRKPSEDSAALWNREQKNPVCIYNECVVLTVINYYSGKEMEVSSLLWKVCRHQEQISLPQIKQGHHAGLVRKTRCVGSTVKTEATLQGTFGPVTSVFCFTLRSLIDDPTLSRPTTLILLFLNFLNLKGFLSFKVRKRGWIWWHKMSVIELQWL